jgi:hypothetical protein
MLLRNPKKPNEVIETSITSEEAARICKSLQSNFAQDLAHQFMFSTRPLSPSQNFWLFKLASEHAEPEVIALHSNLQEFISQVPLMQFRLELDDGNSFGKILLRTGSDKISVFGAYRFCGKIVGDKFYPSHAAWKNLKVQLVLFSVNPRAWMESYGKATGYCCVCGRELTNKESVGYGIGPICRERFGY